MMSTPELSTHPDSLCLPVDIHAHLASLVPCLALAANDRLSAWILTPPHPPAKSKDLKVFLALHLDSETRTDTSLIVKLPFTSPDSVGRPMFGPAALKLGALTNRAPSKCTADKIEASRRTYRWMCLKAEKLGGLWMPFEPVYDELTVKEKEELDGGDKKAALKKKEQQKSANASHLFYEMMPDSIQP